jgi:small subunit ribosomal protein S21
MLLERAGQSGGARRDVPFGIVRPGGDPLLVVLVGHGWRLSSNFEGKRVQVLVRDNNVDQALRALKKKMQREGIFREMKLRGHYEKPSEKKAREKAEAVRRARKLIRKRMQREGLLPSKPRVAHPARPGGR